jgi:hypothetical protein
MKVTHKAIAHKADKHSKHARSSAFVSLSEAAASCKQALLRALYV